MDHFNNKFMCWQNNGSAFQFAILILLFKHKTWVSLVKKAMTFHPNRERVQF
jgi:hypothetical protein